MSFIKKSFICKENAGTVTKVKLVAKVKKHNQLYFGTLILASYCYCEDNVKLRTFFKTLASKNAATWGLKNLRVTTNFYEKQCLQRIT